VSGLMAHVTSAVAKELTLMRGDVRLTHERPPGLSPTRSQAQAACRAQLHLTSLRRQVPAWRDGCAT
jgi:hypothetical protein